VPWLRNGMTIDVTRLIDEVGYTPRSTLETVEEFVALTTGRNIHDVRSAPGGDEEYDAPQAMAG